MRSTAGTAGTAFPNPGLNVNIENSVISSNTAGGVHLENPDPNCENSAVLVKDSVISGNARGIDTQSNFGRVDVLDSTISGNRELGIRIRCGFLSLQSSTVSGNGSVGVSVSGDVRVQDSTISGNGGGGVGVSSHHFHMPGYGHIQNSTISGNAGSGITVARGFPFYYVGAEVRVTNSTISGNRARDGAGILIPFGPANKLTVENSTITGNTASGSGGGINSRGSCYESYCSLRNTIVAGNTAGRADPDLSVVLDPDFPSEHVFSAEYSLIQDLGSTTIVETVPGSNVIGQAPGLGPLRNNGGPTQTHALLAGSPALDQGDPTFTPPPEFDQRGAGFERVFNGRLYLGAFERQPLNAVLVNDRVTFERLRGTARRTSNTAGCPAGSVGTFSCDARLTNIGATPFIAVVQVKVTTLTGGNVLLMDGERLGQGAVFHVPRQDGFADGTLSTGEQVDVPFTVCLKTLQPLRLRTSVLARLGSP